MKKYSVPVIFNFEGVATVRANSKEKAIEAVKEHLRARLGNISDDGSDQIVDWDIDLSGYPEVLEGAIEEDEEDEEDE